MSTTLLKTLTEAGLGSRRRMADAIKKGEVEVNGEVITDFRRPVDPVSDKISLRGLKIDLKPEKAVYLMLNKPKGILSTTSDERGRKTVLDLLPEKYRHLRLYPAGRLDKDSTGLLILTNDGELTYRLTHPKFEREKEYLVSIDGILQKDEILDFERGIMLGEKSTYPAVVKEVKGLPPYNYSIAIHEDKKRQVRLMLESLGHRVLALKRIRIGMLRLGNLKEGEMRELNSREVGALLAKQ